MKDVKNKLNIVKNKWNNLVDKDFIKDRNNKQWGGLPLIAKNHN